MIWHFTNTWNISLSHLMDTETFIWLDLISPHGTCVVVVLVDGISFHIDRNFWRVNCLRKTLFDGPFYHFFLLGVLCKHWRVFSWIILFIFLMDFDLETKGHGLRRILMDYFILFLFLGDLLSLS